MNYKFCLLLLCASLGTSTSFPEDSEIFRVIPHTEIYDNIDRKFLDLFPHDQIRESIDVSTFLKKLREYKGDLNDEEPELKRENKTNLENGIAKPMNFHTGVGIIDVGKQDEIPR